MVSRLTNDTQALLWSMFGTIFSGFLKFGDNVCSQLYLLTMVSLSWQLTYTNDLIYTEVMLGSGFLYLLIKTLVDQQNNKSQVEIDLNTRII